MLIFHGLQNQVPFIVRWPGMFQHCLGGRGEGGAKKAVKEEHVAHITMEACTVNSLLFAQNLTSVPKYFDPDCS